MARLIFTNESKEGREYCSSVDGVNTAVNRCHQVKIQREGDNSNDMDSEKDCDNDGDNTNNHKNTNKIKSATNPACRSTLTRKISSNRSFEASKVAKLASKFGTIVVQKNGKTNDSVIMEKNDFFSRKEISTVEKNIQFFEKDVNEQSKGKIVLVKADKQIELNKNCDPMQSSKTELSKIREHLKPVIKTSSSSTTTTETKCVTSDAKGVKTTIKTTTGPKTASISKTVKHTLTTTKTVSRTTTLLTSVNVNSCAEQKLPPTTNNLNSKNVIGREMDEGIYNIARKNSEKDASLYRSCDIRLLKNAPLSVVEDCGLESALNENTEDTGKVVLSKNNSFLHNGLDKITALKVIINKAEEDFETESENQYQQCEWPSSYDDVENTYADIEYIRNENKISFCEKNYDHQAHNYEVVSSSSSSGEHYDRVSNRLEPFSSLDGQNSESSLELANSLYDETKHNFMSHGNFAGSSNSSGNDYINKNESVYIYINDGRSTNSGISDEWMDINSWDSDESSQKKNIVLKKKLHFGKFHKFKKKKLKFSRRKKFSVCSPSTIYFCENSGQSWKESDRSEELHRDPSTILRSILYSLPNYEAQEVTTLLLDYPEDNSSTNASEIKNQNCIRECYDDFDDSSFEEDEPSIESLNEHTESRLTHNDWLSNINSSQNIYGLVKKARKTVRKSLSSLNQIRKSSISNITINFPSHKNDAEITNSRNNSTSGDKLNIKSSRSINNGKGSIRWTSFKTKLRPKYSTVTPNSSSVFYLNPEDLRFGKSESECDKTVAANRIRRTSGIDFNLTRPTSPPPPPPVDKLKFKDRSNSTTVLPSQSNVYNEHSLTSSGNRSSISEHSFALSESNLSSCSDLQLRFANEPLYQFYAESVAQLSNAASMEYLNESDGYEEIGSVTSRPSALELITPSPNGHGQCRSLWCEVPEVKNSGILGTLSVSRQKLQEAKFEVLTSEASYYKSLSVLDKIFISNIQLKQETLVCKNDWKILFGNVLGVRKCSQKLLSALEKCWQDSIMLTGLGDIIYEYACNNFEVYVKYCSNQVYIDRTLKKLREISGFIQLISQLESDPMCQSLSLHSFLMLPMQRITRMPLLVDAILSKLDPQEDKTDYEKFQITLTAVNRIVKDCNENARKFERYEEMLLLSRQLEFSRKDIKMFSIASSSRWLVRSGSMIHITAQDVKSTITRKLTKQTNKFYFFLFNDILIIAKKKSDDNYAVWDYCLRNVMQMTPIEETIPLFASNNVYLSNRYLLVLTILENHEGKEVEMILNCDSDSTRQRWLEATSSKPTSDNPEEKLYEEWDCPMELAVHAYSAAQPDELSLQAGDVIKVLKKTTDGWYHGERIRDGNIGWFPGNYTVEIASQHKRAKNLKLRHRLLTLSANYLQTQQQKQP